MSTTMRGVTIAMGTAAASFRPRPIARGDIVLVRVEVAPLCTEHRQRRAGEFVDEAGHEGAGVVVDAGASLRVKVGDRVAIMPGSACGLCDPCLHGENMYCADPRDLLSETGSSTGVGTLAEYVLKPDWLLVPIPDEISLRQASSMGCLLGPGFSASKRTALAGEDTLVVSGCGPVGLGMLIHGRRVGARLFAIDTNPYRLDLAAQLGAVPFDARDPHIGQRIREATGGQGASVTVETSGAPNAVGLLANVSAPRARMALLAWGVPVSFPPLPILGLDISACWHWKHVPDSEEMIAAIQDSAALIDLITTHSFDVSDISDAMDLQDAGQCAKVLITFAER